MRNLAVLMALLYLPVAHASSITISATCPQAPTTTTPTSATCGPLNGDFALASASLGLGSDSVSAQAERSQFEGFLIGPRARAVLDFGFELSFSGNGLYLPLLGFSLNGDQNESATASVSWLSISGSIFSGRNTTSFLGSPLCPNIQFCGIPFFDGQHVHVDMELIASSAADGPFNFSSTSASASFSGIQVFTLDPNGPQAHVFLTESPEPATSALAGIGLFLAVITILRRQR